MAMVVLVRGTKAPACQWSVDDEEIISVCARVRVRVRVCVGVWVCVCV